MAALLKVKVLNVHHWTDTKFSFSTIGDQAFRSKNGHFSILGLTGKNCKPLMQAFCIASANYEEKLEFFSIKVPYGPLTSKLQHMNAGVGIPIRSKATGTLIAEELLPRNAFSC